MSRRASHLSRFIFDMTPPKIEPFIEKIIATNIPRANRHPGFETGAEEAVVAWNAPQPYHPAADAFVTNALNDVFGFDKQGHPKPWNLTHRDAAADHHIGRALGRSVVISRHKRNDQPRFPSQYYDISTQP
jgi:hypothetical protein